MSYFSDIYDNLTPSQQNFLDLVINRATELRNSNIGASELLREFSQNVKTGGDWDAKNRTGDKALTESKISNEYLGNFVYGIKINFT